MKTVMTGICLLGLCSASMAAGDAPADALVGCYEAKGNRLLVTWHPAGGIAVADLLGAGVSHLQPNPDEPDLWLEAGDEGKVAAEARFTGIGTDTVTLSWQGPASERERVFSLTGCGYRQGEIVFSRSGIELSALLLLPDSSRPTPGVAFIHGSGDSDRVGASYLRTADYVASTGLAVLIPDKRGVGKSDGDWRQATLEDLAVDAQASVQALASRSSVADSEVGILGVSQGGWVAAEAADDPRIDFVVVFSGAAVPFGDQQRHVLANVARRMELPAAETERLFRLSRLAERFMLEGEVWDAYAAAREEALSGPLAPVAQILPASPTALEWHWGRSFWTFDPATAWKETSAPVLMVFGEEDERDSIPVRDSPKYLQGTISANREAPFEAHVFPGLGHSLTDSGQRHLSPRVLRLLSTWIEEQTVREDHTFSFSCDHPSKAGPQATTEHFELRNDPEVSLHHFLLAWAASEKDEWPTWAPPLAEPRYARLKLEPTEARTWAASVADYTNALGRSPVFDPGLIAVRDLLAGVPGTAVPEADRTLVKAVQSALPIYLRHWWPEHEHANRAWIEAIASPLRKVEGEIGERLVAAYGGAWPEDRIPVDVVPYANPVGAYSTGGRVTIGSRDPALRMPHALEMIFHEASHVDPMEAPLRSALQAAFEATGGEEPDRLWHDTIFYTTGEIVRLVLADREQDDYEHYGRVTGVYRRGERWADELPAFEAHWQPFLASASKDPGVRRAALEALAQQLGGRAGDGDSVPGR